MFRLLKKNLSLLIPIIILNIISIVILSSIIPEELIKQILIVFSGLFIYFIFSQVNYRSYLSLSRILYLLAILILIMTFFFGEPTRGSVRWIRIGNLTLQTSEVVKPILILSLAAFAAHFEKENILHTLSFFNLLMIPVVLIILQPDLGSSIVLLLIGISIAFAYGMPLKIFFALGIFTLLVTPIGFKFLEPYQQERIQVFIDPLSDPLGSGYSVIQSMIAVGSGKIFGRGLGHGTQSQLRFIPERHSDFIFASIAEELGIVGALLVINCYIFLLYKILKIAKNSKDAYGSYIVLGIFTMLFFQISINIGMNLGIIPVTGLTLPLISSGGSSVLSVMICLGIVNSVASSQKSSKAIEIH